MAFGLGSLVEAVVLMLNAVCILHERRFLSKIGWAREDKDFSAPSTVKSQLLNIIHSIRTVMRIPLIGVNITIIVFKMVVG
ncbi:unnamed protein product [Echinostoma caproni]|uniref:Immediate early response 3-interacting protein 1 n=1 Tax=Echinostoma caproni TaxID=27848 RepID=A0A183A4D0_9TREM|nr:unnamed protein product [Echinostoma caproni]